MFLLIKALFILFDLIKKYRKKNSIKYTVIKKYYYYFNIYNLKFNSSLQRTHDPSEIRIRNLIC